MRDKTKRGIAVFVVGIIVGAALWLGISCIPGAHAPIYEGIGVDKATEAPVTEDNSDANIDGAIDVGGGVTVS